MSPAIPPVLNGVVGDYTFSKRRFVEVNTAGHAPFFEKRLIVIIIKALNKNAQVFEELAGHRGVARRPVNRLTTAVANECLAIDRQFVASRVPPEIVVVIHYENLAVRAVTISEKLRGRQSREAASDHHKVIGRLGLPLRQTKRPTLTR